MTIGAFAVVTLVRDAGGEATHLSKWAGLGRRSPLVAAVFAVFLLAFAGIPLTSGFAGKFAVFKAAAEGGAGALVVVGVISSAIAAFFYIRVIVLMFFSEPQAGRTHRRRAVAADDDGDRGGGGGHRGAGCGAAVLPRPGEPGGRLRALSSGFHGSRRAPVSLWDRGPACVHGVGQVTVGFQRANVPLGFFFQTQARRS